MITLINESQNKNSNLLDPIFLQKTNEIRKNFLYNAESLKSIYIQTPSSLSPKFDAICSELKNKDGYELELVKEELLESALKEGIDENHGKTKLFENLMELAKLNEDLSQENKYSSSI